MRAVCARVDGLGKASEALRRCTGLDRHENQFIRSYCLARLAFTHVEASERESTSRLVTAWFLPRLSGHVTSSHARRCSLCRRSWRVVGAV